MSAKDDDTLWQDFPLFAPVGTTIPQYDDSNNSVSDALGALSHVLYDEESPEEVSDNLRDEGNVLFRQNNKESLKRAIAKYTAAINAKCDIPHVNAAAYANRSAAHLKLKNFGKALSDAEMALQNDPTNAKARYRAVVSSSALRKYNKTLSLCDALSQSDEAVKAKDLDWFRNERRKAENEIEIAAKAERERVSASQKYKQAQESLTRALSTRKVTMGFPLFSQQRHYSRTSPSIDAGSGIMLWPVLLIYPNISNEEVREHSDFVEEVSEEARICDLLEVVFPEDAAPPPWDTGGLYSRSRNSLKAFYRVNWTRRFDDPNLGDDMSDFVGSSLGPADVGPWKRLTSNITIGEVVSRDDYIVPMFPVLYILPASANCDKSSELQSLYPS